jgi:predicted alpha/beta-hydrolase family hydrolase
MYYRVVDSQLSERSQKATQFSALLSYKGRPGLMPVTFDIAIDGGQHVTGLLYPSPKQGAANITILLGHGAGAGQTSSFMVKFSEALADRGLDAVTFNFLYTERGRKVPDPGNKLEECYRAVISTVQKHLSLAGNKLIIGGKSMGGRIASQVAAAGVEGLAGLVFLGYPLHPPGKSDQLRDKHLARISAPMLFIQGSRDSFGTPEELNRVFPRLAAPHTLLAIENGDHSFKVPKKGQVSQEQVYSNILDEVARWASEV